MTTNYARLIFGENGIPEIKKLLVLELKEKREQKNVSPERLDEIFRKFGYQGPTVRQIEENPSLLTKRFVWGDHHIGIMLDGSQDDWRDVVRLVRVHVDPIILKYLDTTDGAIDRAIAEFQAECSGLHVNLIQTNLGETYRKVLNNEPVKWGDANSITPRQYAKMWICGSIINQLDEVVVA